MLNKEKNKFLMLNSKNFLRFVFVLVVVTACLPETKD